MYVAITDRDALLDLLANKRLPDSIKSQPEYAPRWFTESKNKLVMLWRDKPRSAIDVPEAIAVRDEALQEFLAFLATYVGTYSPFTAFIRVISKSALEEINNRRVHPRPSAEHLKPLLGAIICETYAQTGKFDRPLNETTIQAAFGTVSNVAARSIWLGYTPLCTRGVCEAWSLARRTLGTDDSTLSPQALTEFWTVIAAGYSLAAGALSTDGLFENYHNPKDLLSISREPQLSSSTRFLLQAVTLGLSRQEIPFSIFDELTREIPQLRETFEQMEKRREDRVKEFDKIVAYLGAENKLDPSLKDFLVGYLMSLIADGQMNYVQLSPSTNDLFPMAPLWFGFLNGINPRSDVLDAGQCLGRRILQYLTFSQDPLSQQPRDIALAELSLIYSEQTGLRRMRMEHTGQLAVELFPGVVGRFRVARNAAESASQSDKRSELDTARLRELQSALRLVDRVLYEIIRDAGADASQGGRESRRTRVK